MKFYRYTFILILSLLISKGEAQEIHFTMFDMTPLTINPALAGDFEGTFRVGGIFRDQYATAIPNEFITPSAYIDAPIFMGFRKNDWFGAGLMFYQDRAGAGNLINGAYKLNASYHLALNKKATSYLSLGFHTGLMQRRIADKDKFIFSDELLSPGTSSVDKANISDQPINYGDYGAGIVFKSTISKTGFLQMGIKAEHFTRVNVSLLTQNDRLPMRMTAFGKADIPISDQFSLIPSALFEIYGPASEFIIQAGGKYLLNEEKDISLRAALGYRVLDATQIILGIDWKDLRLGLGYDITTSGLTSATRGFGGFDIAVSYMVRIFKKPTVDPVIFCPRF